MWPLARNKIWSNSSQRPNVLECNFENGKAAIRKRETKKNASSQCIGSPSQQDANDDHTNNSQKADICQLFLLGMGKYQY